MTSQMKKIKKSFEINAPKEKVWEVLVNNKLNAIWYEAFSTGTHTDTDWKTGSKALFVDGSGNGLISKVVVSRPFEEISLEHQGAIYNNVEDYDGEVAQQIKGGHEDYYLSEKNGVTTLSVEVDMVEEYFAEMSLSWDKALQIISDLSASGSHN